MMNDVRAPTVGATAALEDIELEDVRNRSTVPLPPAIATELPQSIDSKKHYRKQKFPFVFDANRLCLLSDGVMAIAITLLVLDITVPDPRDAAVDGAYVLNYLSNVLWRDVLIYLSVVMLLSFYWIEHAHMFTIITHTNSFMVLLNTAFLIATAFLPFCFKTVIYWPTQYYSSLLVFLTLSVMAGSLLVMWVYATRHRRYCMNEQQVPQDVINYITLNLSILFALHLLGIVLATTTSLVALLILIAIPVLMVLASIKIDVIMYAYITGSQLWKNYRLKSQREDPMNQIELQPAEGTYKEYEGTQVRQTEAERITAFYASKHFRHLVLERVTFFSDAMFAIILTVLVLELSPPMPSSYLHMSTPTNEGVSNTGSQLPNGYVDISPSLSTYSWSPFHLNQVLGDALGSNWGQYVSFITTAVVVTTLWKHHVTAIQGLKNANRFFCLWNIFFLGTLSLVPFSTYIISRWYNVIGSAVPNSLVLVVSSILLTSVFLMSHYSHLSKKFDDDQWKWKIFELLRLGLIVLISFISLGVAWVSTFAAVAVGLLIPVLEILNAFPQIDVVLLLWKGLNHVYTKMQEAPTVPEVTTVKATSGPSIEIAAKNAGTKSPTSLA